MESILKILRARVVEKIPEYGTHGFEHTNRVFELCKKIGKKMGADMSILLPAALLHDIARDEENHAYVSAEKARYILKEFSYNVSKIEAICDAISTHSFSNNKQPIELEAKILSDADKLDAMGAIGIYRAAMYSNEKSRNQEDFIAHFNEKLLTLKGLLFTDIGKKLGEERHQYMVNYLKELNRELV